MEQGDLAYLIVIIGPILLLVVMIRFFEYLRDRSESRPQHRSSVGQEEGKVVGQVDHQHDQQPGVGRDHHSA